MKEDSDSIRAIMDEDEGAGWIVTYADLVTLLLVFFVLLYSISSLDLEKFKYAMKSIQINLGETEPAINILQLLDQSESQEKKISLEDVIGLRSREDELLKDIDKVIKEETIGDNIVLQTSQGRISVMIKGAVLFNAGASELNVEADPIMDKISKLIAEYPEYSINIKGYTDNVPISTAQFPSNWELSAVRATTVLKYLISNGIDPRRLTATGYGELLPIAPNDTEENRAKNRRVEFVLEKKKD